MNNEHNHEHEQPAVDKYTQAINESNVTTDDLVVKNSVDRLLAEHLDENRSESIYRFMFNCIDLTTLNSTDSERSVAAFTRRVNDFEENYPQYPNVAAICVYSNFAGVVRQNLEVSEVNIAVCSANFPSSQAHLEVKCAETALAVGDGADEVDIVLNLGYFADRAYEDLCDEISEIKEAADRCIVIRAGRVIDDVMVADVAEEKMAEICRLLPKELIIDTILRLSSYLGKSEFGRYRGPLGVDMMAVAKADGRGFLLHPCVEINVRRTMGHVANAFRPEPTEPQRLMHIVHDVNYKLKFDNIDNHFVKVI